MKKRLSQLLDATLHRMVAYIRDHYKTSKKVLREKQMSVFKAVYDFFEEQKTFGYIKLPTGTGKTVLFGQIIRAVANGKSKALILVPRVQLVDQTYKSFKRFAPELSVGRINQHHKEYGNQITIATYTSWQLQLLSGEIQLTDFDYVILDEGHRALTPKIIPLVEDVKKVSIVIGFSATPGFSEAKHLKELLDHEIYVMELPEAIQLGLLSGVQVMLVEMDIDLSLTASVRGDYSTKDIEKLINTSKVNNTALEVYQKYFSGKCAIVYANSIQHVSDVVMTFMHAGIEARGIHGKTPKKLQKKILEDYHNKKFDVLVNCDLLIEGFDEPRVSVCLNLRPTQSFVLAEQRGGRVLRLDEDDDQKIAYVVDFIYKESTKRKRSVLFSMITGGALVLPETFSTSQNLKSGMFRSVNEMIDIEGANVIYDVHKVDELTKDAQRYNEQLNLTKLAFDEFKKEVRALGIQSSLKFYEIQKGKNQWPADPRSYYEEWKGWSDIFGPKFLTLKELQKQLKRLKINTQGDYQEEQKNHGDWTSTPIKYYAEIKNWHELFGRKKQSYVTLSELKIQVRKAGITTIYEYRDAWKKESNWPANPDVYYRDHSGKWISYPDLFGKVIGGYIESFDEFKKAVRAVGIQSRNDYNARRDPRWPSNPQDYYKEWKGMIDLLGKEEPVEYVKFTVIKKAIKVKGIKSNKEYQEVRKNSPGWPSQPETAYKKDWKGWVDFLGKTSNKEYDFLSLKDLKESVKKTGARSVPQYRVERKKHIDWPSDPGTYYGDEWISWPNLFGKKWGDR